MGIKEFRERLGEVARGREPVQLTDRGKVVGIYNPLPRMTDEQREKALAALEELGHAQEQWRRDGYDPVEAMASIGLDPWGVPLPQHDR